MITSTIGSILASGVITKVCTGLFAGSTLLTAAKNNGAKHKVERQGYVVNPDRRSFTERTISFIKDYFFLLVPGYNIYKSFKTFLKKDTVYAAERKALYEERERLVKVEPEKTVTTKPEKTETKVVEEVVGEPVVEAKRVVRKPITSTPKREEPVVRTVEVVEPVNPFAGLSLEELVDLQKHYARIFDLRKAKYERRSAAGAPIEELNAIASEAIGIQKLYQQVNERIAVLSLPAPKVPTRRVK